MSRAVAKYGVSVEDRASKALKGIRQNFKHVDDTVGMLKTSLIGVVGVGGFGALIKSSIDAADKIGKLSTRLGISAEELSRLKHAAKLTGVEFNTLTMGLQRMTRRIAEAAQGSGEAVGALQELGLSAQRLNMLSPDRQFKALADALQQVENPADKVRLSMKLLDSEGVALIQTMQGGSAALNQYGRDADRLGVTLDKNATESAARANDAITRMNASLTGVTNTLAVKLGPAIEAVANVMNDMLGPTLDFIGRGFDGIRFLVLQAVIKIIEAWTKLTETIAAGAEFLGLDSMAEKLNNVADAAKNVTDSLSTTAEGFFMGAAGVKGGFNYSEGDPLEDNPVINNALLTNEELLRIQQEANAKLLREDEIAANKRIRLKEAEARAKAQAEQNFWNNAISLMSSGSRAAFNIGKAAAVSQAIFKGYSAAVSAWEAGMSTGGPWAPAVAAAYAAASVAKTAGMISSLSSTQFGGGGGVSVSGSGTISTGASFNGGAPVINQEPETQPRTEVTVNISGGIHDSNSVRDLIGAINVELGDGVMIEANVY